MGFYNHGLSVTSAFACPAESGTRKPFYSYVFIYREVMEQHVNDHEEVLRSPATGKTIDRDKIPTGQLGLSAGARTAAEAAGFGFAADLSAKTADELTVLGFRPRDIRNVSDRLSLFEMNLSVTQSHSIEPAKAEAEHTVPFPLAAVVTPMSSQPSRSTYVEPLHQPLASKIHSVDDVPGTMPEEPKLKKAVITDDARALRRATASAATDSAAPDLSLIERLRRQATMTVEEAAQLYGCSRNTAYRECKLGRIPTLHQGRSIRVITALVFAELHL